MTSVPAEIDRWDRREPPTDLSKFSTWLIDPRRPGTRTEALMQAAPLAEPQQSLEDVEPIREAVIAKMALLEEQDRFILEAIFFEGISQRELGRRLGLQKSYTGRLVARAKERFERILLTSTIIQERVGMQPSWNSAARGHLLDLAPEGEETWDASIELIEQSIEDARYHASFLDDGGEYHPEQLLFNITDIGMCATALLDMKARWSIQRLEDLLVSKQRDYGCGNILAFGLLGIAVRLSDKVARFQNLTATGKTPANESLNDTLDDLVGYTVVARMLVRDQFTLPLEEA